MLDIKSKIGSSERPGLSAFFGVGFFGLAEFGLQLLRLEKLLAADGLRIGGAFYVANGLRVFVALRHDCIIAIFATSCKQLRFLARKLSSDGGGSCNRNLALYVEILKRFAKFGMLLRINKVAVRTQ